jgi:hypothetical protein
MSGNSAAQDYLRHQYFLLHYHNMFMFDPGMSKKDARALAFNRMRQQMGR